MMQNLVSLNSWMGVLSLVLVVGVLICIALSRVLRTGPQKWKEKDYPGKHVFITGGSEGLGKSLACKFAKLGATVTIVSRNADKLKEAQKEIQNFCVKKEQKINIFAADVTVYSEIEKAVNAAVNDSGVIDLLITNAGQAHPGYFFETPIHLLEKEVKLNYLGTVYTIKAALPSIVERATGGHIVLVSTAAAFASFIGYTNYSSSKMAVKGLAEGLRNELQLYNISVSIFFPTGIDTPGFQEEQKSKPQETKIIEGASSLIPPDKVAQALLDGLKRGQYMITNEFISEILRMLSHGITIRDNYFMDLLLTPIMVLISPFVVYSFDSVVRSSKKRISKKNK